MTASWAASKISWMSSKPFVEKCRPYGLGFIASDAPSCLTLEPIAVRVCNRGEQGTTTIIIEELP